MICSHDRCACAVLTERVLVSLLPQDKVRAQDCWSPLFSVAGSTARARELLWEFVVNKWAMLSERYKSMFLLARIVDVRQGEGQGEGQ